jgi:hypothetical protein
MTTKTIDEVRRYLAEEVLGWEHKNKSVMSGYYITPQGEDIVVKAKWKPDQNLPQAFEVLEEYCPKGWCWKLKPHSQGGYILHFFVSESGFEQYYYNGKTIEGTVTGAVLKAENETELLEALENG